MPTRLRLPKLEQKPKAVHVVDTWRDTQNILNDPELADRVKHIRRCILNGTPLPSSYYRKGVDLDTDALLEAEGFMHLHLGRTNTSELLWLVQYDDHVVLLELSDHKHFTTRPVGTLLKSIHDAAIGRKERELASTSAPVAKSLTTIIKRRTGRIPKGPKKP